MKPVVIIAIAVGCSVVAVFGVLFAIDMFEQNKIDKANEDTDELIRLTEQYYPPAIECGRNPVFGCMDKISEDYADALSNLLDKQGNSHAIQETYNIGWNLIYYSFELAKYEKEEAKQAKTDALMEGIEECETEMECYWNRQKFVQRGGLEELIKNP